MKRIFTLLLTSISLITIAQERCGSEAYTKIMMNNNASYAIAIGRVNAQIEKWIENHPNHSEKNIITIPVVVHVVWKTAAENISSTRILEQIEILNKDFRRTNIDAIMTPSVWQNIAADTEIEFCLASTDPNGNPSTGIERIQTSHGSFGMNSDIHTSSAGGADDWPNDDYLNIWVCDLGNNSLLGYASQPNNWIGDGDGVVIGYTNFGNSGNSNAPYHKGRTATHEVGHWLGLRHIWGDNNCGDDNVNDTPEHEQDNAGCPSFPKSSSCSGTGINGEMFMNYMDYTNDACMNLFTNGQKTRMIAAINNYRSNLLSHSLCEGSVGVFEQKNSNRKLIKIVDFLGRRSTKKHINTTLFYIYDNGSVEKKMIVK